MLDAMTTAQREIPMLFSGAMVRAERAGLKTQTRRTLKDQALYREALAGNECWTGFMGWQSMEWALANTDVCGKGCLPRWRVGDHLWVREAWSAEHKWTGTKPSEIPNGDDIWYWADGNPPYGDWTKPKPSIFMPRWASRTILEVTGVRVERLGQITEEDARDEGVETDVWDQALAARNYAKKDAWFCMWGGPECYTDPETYVHMDDIYRASYRTLWESINGPGSWAANPWVVVVEFRRVVANA